MRDHCNGYRAAITVWEDRISPVFESAGFLLIVTIYCGQVTEQMIISFDPRKTQELADTFLREKISILICGAITHEQSEIMQNAGVKIVSFISGSQRDVLAVLKENKSGWDRIKMPGCRQQSNCRARCSNKNKK